jgi:transcriptional regulator with AAA-type ATPase domain
VLLFQAVDDMRFERVGQHQKVPSTTRLRSLPER